MLSSLSNICYPSSTLWRGGRVVNIPLQSFSRGMDLRQSETTAHGGIANGQTRREKARERGVSRKKR